MFHSLISTRLPRRPLPRVCPSTIDQPSPFSTCRSSTGWRASVQEHRSGQARSWALNFGGRGCPKWFFGGVWMGYSGVFLWRRGAKKKQAVCQWCFVLGCSSSLPLVWTWILAIVYILVPLWCVYTVRQRICLYICVLVLFFLTAWSFVYPSFLCTDAARTSSVWVTATVGLLLVGEACAGVSSFFFFFFFPNAISKVVVTASPPRKQN